MNINTLNYVGLVKQAGLFSKLLSYVKKGDKPKLLFDYEKPDLSAYAFTKNNPTSYRGVHFDSSEPRTTKFLDISDDPYMPEGAYYKQPTPEEYATEFYGRPRHEFYEKLYNENPTKFKSNIFNIMGRSPREQSFHHGYRNDWDYEIHRPDLTDSRMELGTDIYRTQVFHQLMRKLNANNAISGVKKDAYDDPRLVEKMQRYADAMVREQGYGKYIK